MRQALASGLVAFGFLVVGASPAHFWLDSGEIGAAGHGLGVMHPPGVPGYTLLLRAATIIPIGSIGFRMAVLSSLFGAVTVALVFRLLERRGAHPWISWGAAVWVCVGLTFVRQSRVVEIYTFAAALMLIVLWGLDPRADASRGVGRRCVAVFAATWAAICFGDLRLVLVPVVLLIWGRAVRRREPWATWAPVCAVAATALVLVLPLSSIGGPAVDWGDPDHVGPFWDHLLASSIVDAYSNEILPASAQLWRHNLDQVVARLAEDLGPPGPMVLVVAVGALWLGPHAPPRVVAATVTWLVAVEVFYAVGINPMGGPERQTGLVLGPLAALCVGDGLRRVVQLRPRIRWAVVPLCWTVLALPPALRSVPDLATTRSWAPHAWTRAALAQLPPRGLLLTQSDDLAAGSISARAIEGARPDVLSFPAQHLHKPRPEALAATPGADVLWSAGTDLDARVKMLLADYPGPVAMEHPGATLFERVRFWSPRGRLPLRIGGSGSAAAPTMARIDAEIDAWLPRLPTAEDRRRLAVSLASYARALVRIQGDVQSATIALEAALSRVHELSSALVTLAALRDRAGDTAGAITLTRRALVVEPDRAVALTNLALYLGRDPATLPEALALAERAVALRPWRPDAWDRVAGLRERAGDADGAAAARSRAQGLLR